MNLFVPGRLCLFGEHSDWAGQYCQINPELMPGYAIVTGIDRGIYAHVKSHRHLIFKTLHCSQKLKIAMEADLLLKQAQTTDFYSYVAGTAYQALIRYQVGGLAIDNYRMDLPLKKGLSSSAAICVLVAKAFNQLYDLGLSLAEEMDLAYWGERTTFSQCGKLDQACAYGRQPILMTFNGDRTTIEPLSVAKKLYLIIVDLAGFKDTQEILTRLNQGYPIAKNSVQQQVQHYLGPINANLVRQAQLAIQQGNVATLGGLMQQAQAEFDRCVAPACPTQLKSPILHELLSYKPLQPYIYGGKGVGSQGDGTAQLVARNQDCQQQAISTIERDFPQMHCYELNIPQN